MINKKTTRAFYHEVLHVQSYSWICVARSLESREKMMRIISVVWRVRCLMCSRTTSNWDLGAGVCSGVGKGHVMVWNQFVRLLPPERAHASFFYNIIRLSNHLLLIDRYMYHLFCFIYYIILYYIYYFFLVLSGRCTS